MGIEKNGLEERPEADKRGERRGIVGGMVSG